MSLVCINTFFCASVPDEILLKSGELHHICGENQTVHASTIWASCCYQWQKASSFMAIWRKDWFGELKSKKLKFLKATIKWFLWYYAMFILWCCVHVCQVKYRPNAPTVLRGITCTFAAGNKIGVVGRTGSGKTTLLSALFRLIDPSSGRILIDGLDICSIGLKDLRMKLSIIPQEPTLFRGSVRSNVDPLGLHTDEDIWEVSKAKNLNHRIVPVPSEMFTKSSIFSRCPCSHILTM